MSARARPPRAICKPGGLAGGAARTIIDERLREREFGIFDRLTTLGIRDRFPEEAAHRRRLGKFYHRPPGGESWADVILRLRSALNTINLHYCDRRVLIVCHQVVVLCLRYILEELTSRTSWRSTSSPTILNCGIAAYDFEPDAKGLCIPELSPVESRRADGGRGRAEDRRARRDDGDAMSAPSRSTRAHSSAHPLPPVVDGDKETKGRILIIAGSRDVARRGAARRPPPRCAPAQASCASLTVESVAVASSACAMPEAMVVGLPEDA